jgi:hypothetical protein
VPLLVHTPVQILEEREVRGEEPFDHAGVHLRIGERPELGDDAREQEDAEVALVVPDARVAQRQELVARRREAHLPHPVDGPRRVDVAARKLKGELGAKAVLARPLGHLDGARRPAHCRVSPSCTIVHSSTSTSFAAPDIPLSATREGQPASKL